MLPPIVLLLFLCHICESLVHNTTCKVVQASLAPECAQYLNYLVPVDWDVAAQDAAAYTAASSTVASSCPFYHNAYYQCNKHFPRCDNGTKTTELMCESVCYRAKGDKDCEYFSDAYFDGECQQSNYLGSNQPCFDIDYYPDDGDSEGLRTWKIVLASIAGIGGLLIAGHFAYRYYQKKNFDPAQYDRRQEALETENARARQAEGENYAQLDDEKSMPMNAVNTQWGPAQQARAQALARQAERNQRMSQGDFSHIQ